jgi:serine/threonine-protein kinase
MSSKPNPQLLRDAKAREQRGELDEAAKLFLSAGDVEEAARVFMTAGQFAKAGRLLFRAVGLSLERMGDANHEQRKLAVRAAICLAKGGETHNAAALFVAAGDRRRAVETLEKAGDTVGAARLKAMADAHGDPRAAQVSGQVTAAKYAAALRHEQAGELAPALAAYIQAKSWADAARLAHKLGKIGDAGGFFEEAAMYYEAAVCWNDVKDTRRCLDALTRVPRDHARYRGCALKVIELGAQFGEVSFEMDQFLTRFVAQGPENPQEMDAFVALGRLYDKAGFSENARECYRKVVAVAPQHRAAQLLKELEQNAKGSAMVYEKIMREDGQFHGDMPRRGGPPPAPLPDLPPLQAPPVARPIMPTPSFGREGPPTGAYPAAPPGYPAQGMPPPYPQGYPPQAYPQGYPPPQGYPQGYPPAYPPGYPQHPYPPQPAGHMPTMAMPYGVPPQTGAMAAPPTGTMPAPQTGAMPAPPTGTMAAPQTGAMAAPQPSLAGDVRPQTMVKPKEAEAESKAPEQTGQRLASGAAATKADPGPIELVPGAIIAERYRLEKQIGQGGTAMVFRASDLELEEEVAIKVFTVVVDDPDLIRRFKQELSVTRQLSHPNIVRLHDIGMHRGFRFLTMEILQGTDLASVLQKGPLPLIKSLEYLVQACSALQLAHERGVVHRDIKPENFFVTTQNVLKVMDFGIAKKNQSQKLTQAGFIAGTPPYMSPEQISGFATVTHLADIYSLGIVAYEMFAGSLPFTHQEMMPLLLMHINEAPQPPIERNPKIPKPLNDLILRLLEKDPAQRVPSMKALAEELVRLRPQLEKASK